MGGLISCSLNASIVSSLNPPYSEPATEMIADRRMPSAVLGVRGDGGIGTPELSPEGSGEEGKGARGGPR